VSESRQDRAALEASIACCWYLIDAGNSDFRISDIARAIGVSERSFYRYFPTRESVIRPILTFENGRFAAEFARALSSGSTMAAAVESAFVASAWGEQRERTRKLVPIMLTDDLLFREYTRTFLDGADPIRDALAASLGYDRQSTEVDLAATTITTSIFGALQRMATNGDDPILVLHRYLNRAAAGILTPNSAHHPVAEESE
jgi:AcrR family transcriptional regulator